MNNQIAIITVVYNNYEVLTDFFTSLKSQETLNFHVFVVDLSTEPQQYAYTPFATVIKGPNRGYAYGANRGIRKAIEEGYSKFIVINSDVYVADNFINQTISALKTNPGSILGGKIYYAPGYEYHKDRYQKEDIGKVIWFAGGSIDWANMITSHIGVDELDKGQFDIPTDVDFITGCFIAYDKSVVDTVGDWDESWFLYYEDTDFCVRAHKKGIRLIYQPSIKLWHKNAQSTGGSGSSIHVMYQEKNRLRFGFKYAPLWTKLHLAKNEVLSYFSKLHTPGK
jgi:GT2 family glycosyltransferase